MNLKSPRSTPFRILTSASPYISAFECVYNMSFSSLSLGILLYTQPALYTFSFELRVTFFHSSLDLIICVRLHSHLLFSLSLFRFVFVRIPRARLNSFITAQLHIILSNLTQFFPIPLYYTQTRCVTLLDICIHIYI